MSAAIYQGLSILYEEMGAFGGALAAVFHLGTVSQGVSSLFGLLILVPGTQLQYVFCMLAAYATGFVLTWLFGVDEDRINEFYGE